MSAILKDVTAEIYVMQQVAGHQSFLYVYGIMGTGLILMEFIEVIKSGNVMISKTIHSYLGNFVIPKATWFCISKRYCEGYNVPAFHGFVTLCHCRNVLINQKFIPKIIDFEKVSLINASITFNIENGSKKSEKYNKCRHHLASEIRNVKGTKQSISSDTYLVVCLLKSTRL